MSSPNSPEFKGPNSVLSVEEKEKILADFWFDRYSAILNYSNIALSDESGLRGKWVEKKLNYSTNRGMFYVFISVIVVFYLLHLILHSRSGVESSATHNVINISLFIGTSILALLAMRGMKRIAYRVFAQRWRRVSREDFLEILKKYRADLDDESTDSKISPQQEHSKPTATRRFFIRRWVDLTRRFIRRWVDHTRRFFFRRWVNLNFFIPFSYKYIWWWTLIVGVATAEMDYFAQTYGSPNQQPTSVGLAFMRAILISVIAYIATNIIRELLSLREHYIKGVEKTEASSQKADQLNLRLSKDVPRLLTITETAIGSNEMANSVKRLLDEVEEENDDALREQYEIFVTTLANIVDNFVKQIEGKGTPLVKQCVLLTFNHYLKTQNEILKNEKRVITRFTTLAEIGKNLVTSFYPADKSAPKEKIEFYGLMVIPPEKFLNYENKQSIGDPNWEKYLESLVDSATRRVPIKKYFLSLRADKPGDLVGPEASDLFFIQVRDELNKSVLVNENNIPFHEARDRAATTRKYFIDSGWPDGERCRPLRDVLDEVYHMPGHCFIREFSQEQYDEYLLDSTKKIPLDYFAIRKGDEWEFCLQTYYHKALDAADIEVFHEGMPDGDIKKWNRVKESLDRIFFPESHEGGVFSIKNYDPKE